jgi:hypothetical protein
MDFKMHGATIKKAKNKNKTKNGERVNSSGSCRS